MKGPTGVTTGRGSGHTYTHRSHGTFLVPVYVIFRWHFPEEP